MTGIILSRRDPGFPPHGPISSDIYLGLKILTDGRGGAYNAGPAYYGGGLHQLLIGTSGVGKGMRVQAPNLLSVFGKSIVVIDPKGELAAITALYRHHMGDEVHIIDPFGVIKGFYAQWPDVYWRLAHAGLIESSGFNPLALLSPGPMLYDDVRGIMQAMIPVAKDDNPFWPLSARAILTGLAMWEVEQHGPKANLVDVYRKLTMPDVIKTFEVNGDTIQLKSGFTSFVNKILQDSEEYAASETVKSLLGRFSKETANETLDSIRTTAETNSEWLNSAPIGNDLRFNNIDLSRLKSGDRPMTIYAILPSERLVDHSIWLRLFVNAVIRACMKPGRNRSVLLMMDEFPALGFMEVIERQWGVARGYGLAFWPALQNFSQLTETYPKYETMLSSIGVVQSFRPGDPTTLDYLTSKVGTRTRVKLGYNQGSGSSDSGKHNSNRGISKEQIPMPWMPKDMLTDMPDDRALLALGGKSKVAIMNMPHLYKQMRISSQRALDNPYELTPRS